MRLSPNARAYHMSGAGTVATIMPSTQYARVILVSPMETLVTGWTPARGFTYDPTNWLARYTPGGCITDLVAEIVVVVTEAAEKAGAPKEQVAC